MATKQKNDFQLPTGKVTLELIEKRSNVVVKDPLEKDAYTGTTWSICVPQKPNGELVDPLTKEEREFLESELGYPEGTLSIHKDPDKNFWISKKALIQLSKIGRKPSSMNITLDKSNPYEYLLYKIACVSPMVAPNWKQRFERAEYKFVIKDEDAELREELTATQKKNKVLKHVISLENDKKGLYDLLRLVGLEKASKPVSKDTNIDWLYNELMKLTDDKKNINIIYDILETGVDELGAKVLLVDGISEGIILHRGSVFKTAGGELLGYSEEEAIKNLNSPENQQLRILIEKKAKIK